MDFEKVDPAPLGLLGPPGHISGPRSGGNGLHLAATAAARPWSLAASGGAAAGFELCAVRFGNAR